MSIPTLADHLAGKVEIAPGPAPSRVHILGDERPVKKSEARRDDMGMASEETSDPCPPQPAAPVVAPAIRPFFNPPKEETMPKGVYQRKRRKAKAASEPAPAASATTTKERSPRRKRPPAVLPPRRSGEARFGVFEDGTVHLATEGCKGTLSPDEALDLLHFVEKLAAAGWIRARGKGAATS